MLFSWNLLASILCNTIFYQDQWSTALRHIAYKHDELITVYLKLITAYLKLPPILMSGTPSSLRSVFPSYPQTFMCSTSVTSIVDIQNWSTLFGFNSLSYSERNWAIIPNFWHGFIDGVAPNLSAALDSIYMAFMSIWGRRIPIFRCTSCEKPQSLPWQTGNKCMIVFQEKFPTFLLNSNFAQHSIGH